MTITSYELYNARTLPYREQIKVLKAARDNGGLTLNISLRGVTATDVDAELLNQANKLEAAEKKAKQVATESVSKVQPIEENPATEAPVLVHDAEDALLTVSAADIAEYSKDYPKQSHHWIEDVAVPQIELKAFSQITRAKFPAVPNTPLTAAVHAVILKAERPNFVPINLFDDITALYKSLWKTTHFAVEKSYSLGGALVEARKKGGAIVLHVGVKVTERAPVFLESQVQYYSPESIADKWSQKPTQKTGRTSNTLFNT